MIEKAFCLNHYCTLTIYGGCIKCNKELFGGEE